MSDTRSQPRLKDEKPFVARLRAWDDDALFKAERDVRTLIEHPGWLVVQGLLSDSREDALARIIDNPSVKTGKQYARETGLLAGLRLSGAAARAVLSAAEDVRREISERQEQ